MAFSAATEAPAPDRQIATTAYLTLLRGAAFLGGRGGLGGGIPAPVGIVHAKVLGNSLRELDRFLNVLIDEVAACACPDGIDPVEFAGRRNTANKLRAFYAALGRSSPDHDRLMALGRSRDCLFHCGGVARRADAQNGSRMTAGWPPSAGLSNAPLMSVALGEMLVMTAIDIQRVCIFYEDVAADLMAAGLAEERPAYLRIRTSAPSSA